MIFWGGIDNNRLLCEETIEEVEQAVIDLIRDAGKNGGLPVGIVLAVVFLFPGILERAPNNRR